jgi:HAD superfamily phosphoserine phosphatase-like hydrolase
VSASLDIWVKPFADKYGVSCLCTETQYINGKCTGKFETPNCNGLEKANRIRQRYDLAQYNEVIAYGNSRGDAAMFDLAAKTVYIRRKIGDR